MKRRYFLNLCIRAGTLGLLSLVGSQSPIFAQTKEIGRAVIICFNQSKKLKIKTSDLLEYIEVIKIKSRKGISYVDIGNSLKQIFEEASREGYIRFSGFLEELDLSDKESSVKKFGITEYKNLIIIKGIQKNARNIIR